MSMDHTGMTGNGARSSDDNAVTDAPLMSATPVWETRGKKRRGMGRASAAGAATTVAAEPRSFEPSGEGAIGETPKGETRLHETRPMAEPVRTYEPTRHGTTTASAAMAADPMTGRPDLTTRADDDAGLISPIGRTRTAAPARRSGAPMAAIAAGVVALGAVGAAGWYATRGGDGVAELTPGADSLAVAEAPMTTEPAMATPSASTTSTAPGALAAATPAPSTPAAERTSTIRTAQVRSDAPARPAAATGAASAADQGIDASGTASLPAGPQAYSTLNPGSGGAAATPDATGASAVTTAPATATPAPMPSTPPIISVTPAPVPTPAETAPSGVTPPQ
ncbi:hypothetical protein LRS10_10865 [Phenylobacterium sp. J426]|uniref:hypothetical protein n=1 Tax=Phenylobacterium sp. J426 TaxID=2898439 RepID=UPI0021519A40|nr:hypothetical protein [Phenylobacterium sp. J426]MCR5874625.1 hypothetical protein [Phenylobacterium sp. J426]